MLFPNVVGLTLSVAQLSLFVKYGIYKEPAAGVGSESEPIVEAEAVEAEAEKEEDKTKGAQ